MLAVWAVYRLILLAISVPTTSVYWSVLIAGEVNDDGLAVVRGRMLVSAIVELALLALLLLRSGPVARWLLPAPEGGADRVRPWIGVGVVLCALPAFARTLTSVISRTVVHYGPDDTTWGWTDRFHGAYGQELAVLALTLVFLALPRLVRRFTPAPVSESDA